MVEGLGFRGSGFRATLCSHEWHERQASSSRAVWEEVHMLGAGRTLASCGACFKVHKVLCCKVPIAATALRSCTLPVLMLRKSYLARQRQNTDNSRPELRTNALRFHAEKDRQGPCPLAPTLTGTDGAAVRNDAGGQAKC